MSVIAYRKHLYGTNEDSKKGSFSSPSSNNNISMEQWQSWTKFLYKPLASKVIKLQVNFQLKYSPKLSTSSMQRKSTNRHLILTKHSE